MTPLNAIIFDLDGTLANTLPVCFQAFQSTLEHFNGRRPSQDEVAAYFGPTEEGMLEKMLPGRLDQALPYFLDVYEQVHAQCPQPFPGIEEALSLAKEKGLRTAIVTGKGRYTTEISLRLLGLERWIDQVETGHLDRADKPRSFRKVLDLWQMPPGRAAYIGDTPYDIDASLQVGMLPLGAAWAGTSTLLQEPHPRAHAIFKDLPSFISWLSRL